MTDYVFNEARNKIPNRVQNDGKSSNIGACATMTGNLLASRQQVPLLAFLLIVIIAAGFPFKCVKDYAFNV